MNEPPTTEEFLKVLQRRNQALETVLNHTNESYTLEPSTNPVRYESTTKLPKAELGPITDPAELALAKILSPPDLKELLPEPIALSERLPGDGDVLNSGPCSLAWLGREFPVCHWKWELTDVCFAPEYTHWLPASVRYLPAWVEL